MDGILWHDTMGHEIDLMDEKVIHHKCSEQGWLDDAATQDRPDGDHESMRKWLVIMMKLDISDDKCQGKMDPKVQVSLMKKFDFERRRSDPSWKNGFLVKGQIIKK